MELPRIFDKILRNWPSLKLAVDNQSSGFSYNEFVNWLCEVITEISADNPYIDEDNLVEYIKEVLDNELSTFIEDGSLAQVCKDLVTVDSLFKAKKFDEISSYLKQIPDLSSSSIILHTANESDVSDSESETERIENVDASLNDGNILAIEQSQNNFPPSANNNSSQHAHLNITNNENMHLDDDDGWKTVKSNRKR